MTEFFHSRNNVDMFESEFTRRNCLSFCFVNYVKDFFLSSFWNMSILFCSSSSSCVTLHFPLPLSVHTCVWLVNQPRCISASVFSPHSCWFGCFTSVFPASSCPVFQLLRPSSSCCTCSCLLLWLLNFFFWTALSSLPVCSWVPLC